jgi:peptidoglycan/LPS O-acetylase OafA/YrhL
LAPKGATRFAGLALAGLLVLCAATQALDQRNAVPLVLLVAVPSLLILVSRDWAILTSWQRVIQAAGNLTYSTYLLHFPLQLLLIIGVATTGARLPVASPLFLFAYVATVLTVAAASYRAFELPAQKWLRRLALRQPETA